MRTTASANGATTSGLTTSASGPSPKRSAGRRSWPSRQPPPPPGPAPEPPGGPPIRALTAPAAPPVREEIVARLGMREPLMLVRGFNRENMWLGVETFRRERDKKEALLARVAETEKPGIVYVATRKRAEEVSSD